MPGQRTLPGLGLVGFWNLGSSGWKPEHDENLRKLSVLVQGRVLSRVTALPASPTDGMIYIVPEGATSNANAVAVRDNGAWVFIQPAKGIRLFVEDTGTFIYWNGTAWIEEDAGEVYTFLGLQDTPTSYSTHSGKVVRVNALGDALEFTDASELLTAAGGKIGWRILITATEHGSTAGLDELVFGATQAIGGLPIANGGTPANAYDGASNTTWSASATTGTTYIGYIFQQPRKVDQITIRAHDTQPTYTPTAFAVQSTTLANPSEGDWVDEWAVEVTVPWTSGEVRAFDAPKPAGYFVDAPSDGKIYGRRNAGWAEVAGGGGGGGGLVDAGDLDGPAFISAPIERIGSAPDVVIQATGGTFVDVPFTQAVRPEGLVWRFGTISGGQSTGFDWFVNYEVNTELLVRFVPSREANYDEMRVYLDGVEVASSMGISSGVTGESVVVIPPGAHTIRAAYSKDGSGTQLDDTVYLLAFGITVPRDELSYPNGTLGTYQGVVYAVTNLEGATAGPVEEPDSWTALNYPTPTPVLPLAGSRATVIGDFGATLVSRSPSDTVLTIAPNVSYPGATINLVRGGFGALNIEPGAGVTLRSVDDLVSLRAAFSTASLLCLTPNEWLLLGDLA